MEIQYLKMLKENPTKYGKKFNSSIDGISIDEIIQLEQKYNNGKVFPKALRELLYLGGQDCYFLEYGTNDSQEELQQFVREQIVNRHINITRPFYAIDVYNAYTTNLIVYLDEGDNPTVHEIRYSEDEKISGVINTLQGYTESLIKRVKQGLNPF